MRILIVVESKHLGNTIKIAKAMKNVAPVTITNVENAIRYNFSDYNIVGYGSGIYMGKHDKRLMNFCDHLCDEKGYSFVFSTSGGADFKSNNKALVELLKTKNKIVLGTFSCIALDKFFVLRLMGGVNKGHPNETDYSEAQKFVLNIIEDRKSVV